MECSTWNTIHVWEDWMVCTKSRSVPRGTLDSEVALHAGLLNESHFTLPALRCLGPRFPLHSTWLACTPTRLCVPQLLIPLNVTVEYLLVGANLWWGRASGGWGAGWLLLEGLCGRRGPGT